MALSCRMPRGEMKQSTDLLQGTLDLLILKSLALAPMHGWGIAERIQQVSRSEEHTSELQSQSNLVCRLLLEKKKTARTSIRPIPPGAYALVSSSRCPDLRAGSRT